MRSNLKYIRCVAVAVVICVLAAVSAHGAVITWGPATKIIGDTDVLNSYIPVGAFNLGASGVSSTTVNGVTFAPFPITGASDTIGNFSLSYTGSGYPYNTAFGSTVAPFSSLSGAYQTLLQSGAAIYNGEITLTISGLTPGRMYYFEWWSNDSGPKFSPYSTTATNGNTVAVNDNTSGYTAGGVGSWAVGTFTADTAPEVITFSGSAATPLVNAFELQAVPEPASLSLLAVGSLALLRRGRSLSARGIVGNLFQD